MEWKGPIRTINMDLPDDMHLQVKSVAPLRKMSLRQAYIQGMTNWLNAGESSGARIPASEGDSDDPGAGTNPVPNSGPDLNNGPTLVIHSQQIERVTEEEWEFVKPALDIYRGGVDIATKPLAENMHAFRVLSDLILKARAHGDKDSVVPAPSPDTGKSMDELFKVEEAIRGVVEESQRSTEAIEQAGKALEEHGEQVRAGRKRNKGGASGRR
jgi:hypothetical protein